MAWWDERARAARSDAEREDADRPGEDPATAAKAAVYTRQDVVRLVSLLSSVNQQLRAIKLLLAGLLVLAAIGLLI